MSKLTILLMAAAVVLAGEPKQVFTGTITESMCKMNHKMMHISPDDKCVRDCVKASSGKTKYVLMGQDQGVSLERSGDAGTVRRQEGASYRRPLSKNRRDRGRAN